MMLANMLLQASGMCPSGSDMTHYIESFQFVKAITCQYAGGPMPMLVLGLIVYGGVGLALFIRTGSVVIPFVLLLLSGGAIMAQVSGAAVGVATMVVLGLIGGVPAYLYYRYSA